MKNKTMKFTDGTSPVTLGQEVVITNVNRRDGGYSVGVVSKIGNKLVTIKAKESNYEIASFYLEGGEKSYYSHNSIYSSVPAYEAYTKKAKLVSAFEYVVKYSMHSFKDVSEENLHKVMELLGVKDQVETRLKTQK
jgi:hypothetical protein